MRLLPIWACIVASFILESLCLTGPCSGKQSVGTFAERMVAADYIFERCFDALDCSADWLIQHGKSAVLGALGYINHAGSTVPSTIDATLADAARLLGLHNLGIDPYTAVGELPCCETVRPKSFLCRTLVASAHCPEAVLWCLQWRLASSSGASSSACLGSRLQGQTASEAAAQLHANGSANGSVATHRAKRSFKSSQPSPQSCLVLLWLY